MCECVRGEYVCVSGECVSVCVCVSDECVSGECVSGEVCV